MGGEGERISSTSIRLMQPWSQKVSRSDYFFSLSFLALLELVIKPKPSKKEGYMFGFFFPSLPLTVSRRGKEGRGRVFFAVIIKAANFEPLQLAAEDYDAFSNY